jgi:hypothetical protein
MKWNCSSLDPAPKFALTDIKICLPYRLMDDAGKNAISHEDAIVLLD